MELEPNFRLQLQRLKVLPPAPAIQYCLGSGSTALLLTLLYYPCGVLMLKGKLFAYIIALFFRMISAFSLSDALGSVLGSSPFNVSSYCKTPLEENSDRASTELHDIVQITSPISYNSFFEKFLLKNQPCLFSSWITEAWKSCEDWKHANYPNFSFLDKLFGSCVVPVADCGYAY